MTTIHPTASIPTWLAPVPKATHERMSISRRHGFVGGTPRRKSADQIRDEYATAFYVAVHGVLVRHRSDALDVAGYAVAGLLGKDFAAKAKRYPDPTRYGRAHARNVAADYDRRQAADRGEGARRGRRIASMDADVSGFERAVVRGIDWDNAVVMAIDIRNLLTGVPQSISAREFEAFYLVKVEGRTASSVAQQRGVRRETISRTCSKVRAALVAAAREAGLAEAAAA